MTCIAIANTKGGSGKTTLAANLGAYLADCGWRVLLIDADIQPTLSNYFPIEANQSGLTSMMTELNTDMSVSRIPAQEMDIVYSDDPDGRLHEWIMRQPDGRLRMRAAVNDFRKHYDIVLIDTQGAAGLYRRHTAAVESRAVPDGSHARRKTHRGAVPYGRLPG